MRRLPTITALLCLSVLAAGLALAASASASSRQVTIMQDDRLLFRSGNAERARTLDEFKALGADIVKVQVYWNEIAPGPKKPAGFDGSNPGNYNWSTYDSIVQGALARGLRPFLALGGRAPDWAIRKRTKSHNGTYRPSAREFQLFARAAGRRYPQVKLWSLWNEANLGSWLQPQRGKHGVPLSPSIYRKLYLAGFRGLRDSGHGGDTILLGELMPLGQTSARKVPPLDFLREMACLDKRYHQIRGRAARRRGCRRVGRFPTSGIAYHPYTPRGGVSAKPRSNEASISTLRRLTRVLDALARRGKLPHRLPIWITEFGFQTNPPDPFQFSIHKVPGFLDESQWLAFRNRRVKSYSQYTLADDKAGPGNVFRRWAGFQMGLRFNSGKQKRNVYAAFRLPVFVRVRGRRVEVFGARRPQPGAIATVQSRRKGHAFHLLGHIRLNSKGYFRRVFRVSGASNRVYRITVGQLSRTKRPARR
jgi:hypothetical protein